ncbi:MAG: IclR family transcriptional regulator [Bacillota bacterium]
MLKVVDRTLEILEYICSSNKKEFTLAELSEAFNLNKTVMYRSLRVLTERGYLRQLNNRGSYSIGLKLMELGSQANKKLDILQEVVPYMKKMSEEFKETISLGILKDKEVVYIYKIDSPHFLKTDLQVGASVPSYCTALGKSILAWLSKGQLENILGGENKEGENHFASYTKNTITTYDQIIEELRRVKEQGYAVDNEEYITGITCIAVPIFSQDGFPTCAISVSGPSTRIRGQEMEDIIEYLKAISPILTI